MTPPAAATLHHTDTGARLHLLQCPHLVSASPIHQAHPADERQVCQWSENEIAGVGRTYHDSVEAALEDMGAGGGLPQRLETPLPWPTPGNAAAQTRPVSTVPEVRTKAPGPGGGATDPAFHDAEAARAWRPMVDRSQLCAACDSLRDEPPHPGARPGHDDLTRPFARAIDAKRQLLQASLSPRQSAALLASISVDIRKFCDVASPGFLVPRVSVASAAVAGQLGVDLCQKVWQEQPSFDPGRTVFHLEHVVPVQSLRSSCLSAADEDGIMKVLRNAQVAWILKSEDRELSRLGFRTRRSSPEQAYEAAGIELRDCMHR